MHLIDIEVFSVKREVPQKGFIRLKVSCDREIKGPNNSALLLDIVNLEHVTFQRQVALGSPGLLIAFRL